jgi:carbon storage regulator
MLIMRRRVGEKFSIGPDIEIEVLEISHTRVRIGVSAPPSIPIVREEVARTGRENQAAAASIGTDAFAWVCDRLRIAGGALTRSQTLDASLHDKISKKS